MCLLHCLCIVCILHEYKYKHTNSFSPANSVKYVIVCIKIGGGAAHSTSWNWFKPDFWKTADWWKISSRNAKTYFWVLLLLKCSNRILENSRLLEMLKLISEFFLMLALVFMATIWASSSEGILVKELTMSKYLQILPRFIC